MSTSKQNIERQVRNIKGKYPDAIIVKEVYTGKKFQGRKEFERILKIVDKGDMIIFNSVSRMSRNDEEGFNLYEELYLKGVDGEPKGRMKKKEGIRSYATLSTTAEIVSTYDKKKKWDELDIRSRTDEFAKDILKIWSIEDK